jgi:hypothetical protein
VYFCSLIEERNLNNLFSVNLLITELISLFLFQDISGVYFFGGKSRTLNSSALSRNTKLAQELWNTSCDLFLQSQLFVK